MAKTAISGVFSSPLDAILGTRAKVGILRVLSRSSVPLGLREVSRRTEMAYRGIELAIRELLVLGILEQIDGSRERLIRIAASHRLAASLESLLAAEADYRPALRSELSAMASRGVAEGVMAVAIVGAATSGEEQVGDPLEILVLTGTVETARKWQRHFEQAGTELSRRFGVHLQVVSYDLAQARRFWATRTAAAERNIRAAESLVGGELVSLLEAAGV